MNKIVVLGIYLGKFPNNYKLFLKSVEKNLAVDFKIFTDQKLKSTLKNLEYINTSLDSLNDLVKRNLGDKYSISYSYKCCDFRPAYGLIFKDYIKDYYFWGHCDFDMIFGDIRKFISDDILNKYDKILSQGHLSLYRNTNEVNNRYKDNGSLCGNYDEVFSNAENVAFDEINGIGQIYYKNKYLFYDKRIFADISVIYKRFRLALKDKNYNNQVFYWENGHVYRAYYDGKKIQRDEFIYIHFKQRKYLENKVNDIDNCNSFYICDKGFIPKKEGIPTLKEIKKYNTYKGYVYEKIEVLKYKISTFSKKIKNKIWK